MFTPNIKSIDKAEGKLRLVVVFSDGTNTVEDVIFVSATNVKPTLINRCNELNSLYSVSIGTGSFDITPNTKTQAELDKETFFTDYSKWQRIKSLIDDGILSGNEPAVVNLKNKVQTEFKPEYFNL